MSTGTYNRLRLHADASNVDVIRAARKKIARKCRRDNAWRQARHAFYREMLGQHKAAADLYAIFRS